MTEKMKLLLDIFGKITAGVLMAAAAYITIFWGTEAKISAMILWQVLSVSAVCSAPVLLFAADNGKELSKRGMLVRQFLYFMFVNVVVLGLGRRFEWFEFRNLGMVAVMEVLIIAVYALVNLVSYLSERSVAQDMNERLRKMRGDSRM